ncbi:conserved hypothetical protein [Talaromyces stipitatus ATCC 10500]|uniref:HNH nuclease domain-containing protein n=1 Tax=Talaromyces stipitatus (strain ATCC 10500 / CBS 375.48 / QM 6759 / NRRL 1006) TaxID=441959 RepID=B8MGZ2_TALSN|nr:uncharacterized protein TSTA_014650 [Talaromyces stipitatus ATCC 10500]EED16373.1 conserved hypothetical protein [Talaromyces stipitatus ATCC 10500]
MANLQIEFSESLFYKQNSFWVTKNPVFRTDQYSCVVTKLPDTTCEDHFPAELFEGINVRTNAAYIIPFKLGKFTNNAREQVRLWTTIYALFPELKDIIGQSSVNEP